MCILPGHTERKYLAFPINQMKGRKKKSYPVTAEEEDIGGKETIESVFKRWLTGISYNDISMIND